MYPEIGGFIIQQLDGSSKLSNLESTPEQSKLQIDHVEADIKAALTSRVDTVTADAENDSLLRDLTEEDLRVTPRNFWTRYDYSEQFQDFPAVFPYRRWVHGNVTDTVHVHSSESEVPFGRTMICLP